MKYIHVKNMEKFHPGYKDKAYYWAKIHCSMVHGDPDCEMIDNEIDWGRLIKFILISLGTKKGIPLDFVYLSRKGIVNENRPISKTLEALRNFLSVEEISSDRVEKSREEYSRVTKDDFVIKNPKTMERLEEIRDVITHLNTTCKKQFPTKSKTSSRFVSARLDEGYTVADLKKVVDKKSAEWSGTTMAKYLRPETLFNATKFESYINEPDPEEPGSSKEMEDLA